MKSFQLIITNVFIVLCSNAWEKYYNLYEFLSLDCFYYTEKINDIIDGKKYEIRPTIKYCVKSFKNVNHSEINGSILTFDQLKVQNVSVKNLIDWLTPVDLIEKYQDYLQTNDSSTMEYFVNCTRPWFGSFCQYKFYDNEPFSKIDLERVRSCYVYLKCDRGSNSLCLDWREICDGKIDCFDGGEDEKNCHELLMNQCAENEYQCRNGMCIDESFLLDNLERQYFSECLDGSDDVRKIFVDRCTYNRLELKCEDATCLPSFQTIDDDGECQLWPIYQNMVSFYNTDNVYRNSGRWYSDQMTSYVQCWDRFICLTYILQKKTALQCETICDSLGKCEVEIRQRCSILFDSSAFPISNHLERFDYLANQSFNITNMFICYNHYQCPFITLPDHWNNSTCLAINKLQWPLPEKLFLAFYSCTRPDENKNIDCDQPSMFRCWGTKKCIPKHHVMDGIPDCYGGFDESPAAKSCELNDRHRFQCTSEVKCISPIVQENNHKDCIGGEDEVEKKFLTNSIDKLPFSALCDGETDIFTLENETDETHCEEWACANQYTRCNGPWSCPKGIDELNCSERALNSDWKELIQCPEDHHLCISPTTYTMECLHVNRTDDGIVDCLGATDERTHCRREYPNDLTTRYRCWNSTKCVHYDRRCYACGGIDGMDKLCVLYFDDDSQNIDAFKANFFFHQTSDLELHRKSPFSVQSSRPFPELPPSTAAVETRSVRQKKHSEPSQNSEILTQKLVPFCHRGVSIFVGNNETKSCFCPPQFYGPRCEYQNQRVVLTLRFHKETLATFDIIGIVVTLVDQTGSIHSYEQLTYIPTHDCNTKFIIYLLYRDQPKDMNKNYTVQIDAYHKVTFVLLRSWSLPIKFLFMPVNRLSAQLIVPTRPHGSSSCDHNSHPSMTNTSIELCKHIVDSFKLMKSSFTQQKSSSCSSDSISVGLVNNRSICLCPLTKVGPRCLLESVCHTATCSNGGLCVPNDVGSFFGDFTCVCPDGYSGDMCEIHDTKIDISFVDIPIPQSLLAHFITTVPYSILGENVNPIRVTTPKKIPLDKDTVTFYQSFPFNILFAQIEHQYYLTVLQHNDTPSAIISTQINSLQRCPHIRELFDQQTVNYTVLRRAKYYHVPCRDRADLPCFHDNQAFMCLCTKDRQGNCFPFDFSLTYDCPGWNDCENNAKCYQNHPTCPSKTICVCDECSYGAKCQLSTRDFSLSLDAILGYHIYPRLSIARQSIFVKISISLAVFMFTVGLVNAILSILTFQNKSIRNVGCGYYLLASAINSILIVIVLNLKVWFLILSQMSVITSPSFLKGGCISIDFLLHSVISITDWFNACVAFERMLTIFLDVKFNQKKSQQAARWIIILVPLLTIVSVIYDPIHRHLLDDEEEQRTWCVVRYNSHLRIFHSFVTIFHFITPFLFNIISPMGIIFVASLRRAVAKKQQTFTQHLKEQFHHHYHLFISSIVLIILALPRLIISFLSGCMKSAREPTLFLVGYFIPFVPSLLTFIIFVLPSKTYKDAFMKTIKRKWNARPQFFNGT